MAVYSVGQASGVDSNVRLRGALGALMQAASGTLQSRDGMLDGGLAASRTGGMVIRVTPGRAFVQGPAGGQLGYIAVNDANRDLTIADGSAAARTDLICIQVRDNPFDSSGQTDTRLVVVQGTSGGGVPAVPSGHLKLWEVPVASGISSGTGGLTADPVDKRPARAVAAGGVVPVADTTERNALLLYPGLTVYNRTSKQLESYDGTAWSTGNTSWTPTLTATGGSPSVGNGTVGGTYRVRNGWCSARLAFTWGNSTNGGSGAMRLSLPGDAPAIAGDTIGYARARDASATTAFGRFVFAETATTMMFDGPAGSSDRLTATSPFTWTNPDVLTAVLHYPVGP